jgi:hypothetical protein
VFGFVLYQGWKHFDHVQRQQITQLSYRTPKPPHSPAEQSCSELLVIAADQMELGMAAVVRINRVSAAE